VALSDGSLAGIVGRILEELGYDPSDQHFAKTPERWVKMLAEFRAPLNEDPADILNTEFEDEYKGLVVVDNIPFSSLCAHHLAPFQGVAHVGYLPDGKVVGISKLARLVEHYTHRISIQERATEQVAYAIESVLKPRGAAVVLEANHTCMSVRGIRSVGSWTRTAALTGVLLKNYGGCRDEFYTLIGRSRS
jgi:GTP cyclohydrolase I